MTFCDFCDFSVVSPCEALRLCRGEVHLQSTTTLSGGGVAGAGLAWHGLASCHLQSLRGKSHLGMTQLVAAPPMQPIHERESPELDSPTDEFFSSKVRLQSHVRPRFQQGLLRSHTQKKQ